MIGAAVAVAGALALLTSVGWLGLCGVHAKSSCYASRHPFGYCGESLERFPRTSRSLAADRNPDDRDPRRGVARGLFSPSRLKKQAGCSSMGLPA